MPGPRTIVVIPAFNAETTLERVYADLPLDVIDHVLVVDDASRDRTVEIARGLDVELIEHGRNRGYGANQKTCYRRALALGAEIVVMVHADYQYDARMVRAARDVLRMGVLEVVIGNRIRTRDEALGGGMPRAKYLANRGLTAVENLLSGQNLGEWHSGFRGYRRSVLEALELDSFDDGFLFDSQLLLQCVDRGYRIGDLPVPVRYHAEASSISYVDSTRYALGTLRLFARWKLHRWGIVADRRFR